ncbi:hypothetical protein [Alloactinosynnema sp. L-07]|uniref:hypothetical protein n=1 Tax=Alloactinosynnema sp. L-07 TaxID=1653480 RepID=UPI0006B63437|nr:hypothetical protein [Alloactinosynnema sp. L-07]
MRNGKPVKRRPVVAGTRRRTAVAVLDPVPDVEPAEDLPDDVEADSGVAPSRRAFAVLVGISVALVATGVIALVAAGRVGPDNSALVDVDTTSQVGQEIDAGLEQIFSYRFDDTKTTENAAADLLVGDAKAQYEKLFDQVRRHSGEQKLSLRSRVAISGVTMLSGDRAQLLVFIDQSATRGDTDVSSSGAAQLSVQAQRVDDRWRITGLRSL